MEKVADKIFAFLKLKDIDIQKILLRKRLEAEFGMKVAHLNKVEQNAYVKVKIKENTIDEDFLKDISKKDCVFPDIDYMIYY